MNKLGVLFCLLVGLVWSCQPTTKSAIDVSMISKDEATVLRGEHIFRQDCSACHNFRQDGIGPHLGGVTERQSYKWLFQFIRNPKAMIDAGDAHAMELFEKFHVYMPSYGMHSDENIDRLIAYLHINPAPTNDFVEEEGQTALANPIEPVIQKSDIVVEMEARWKLPASSDNLPRTRIAKMDGPVDSDRTFISDLRGKMFELAEGGYTEFMDMSTLESDFINRPGLATGFGSFAFHPDFVNNGLVYTTHSEPAATQPADFAYDDSIRVTLQWVLTERKMSDPTSQQFDGSSRELLRIDMFSGIHGMQEIKFNPNAVQGDPEYGMLYVCLGDGGSAENGFLHLTQNPDRLWGSIIRIDPAGRNSTNGQYGIPQDNPTFDRNYPNEVYAIGFRNPHRISWDQQGRLFASCIGHHKIEELNVIQPGGNYGWPQREGTFLMNPHGDMNNIYALPEDDAKEDYIYPAMQFDHDEGNAISGGFEYTGMLIPALKGKYICGGIVHGRLFVVDMADLQSGKAISPKEWHVAVDGVVADLQELCGSDRVDLRFGRDQQGELYLFTKADGQVYRLGSASDI